MLQMTPFRNMPDDVASTNQATIDDIKSGQIQIYKGPIKDQNGALKVKDGEVLPDKDVLGMNWLAEGIEGKLPS